MTTMTQQALAVTVGVDTHADAHVAAEVDVVGAILGTASFPATARGYAALVRWAQRLGPVERFGVEGTGSYGAGLAELTDPTAAVQARAATVGTRLQGAGCRDHRARPAACRVVDPADAG